jgi:hypothetical protein
MGTWRHRHCVTAEELAEIGALLCDHEPRDLALRMVRAEARLREGLRATMTHIADRELQSDAEAGRDMAPLSDAERLARAVVLFFKGTAWTPQDTENWTALTGMKECSNRALCNFARLIERKEATKPRGTEL